MRKSREDKLISWPAEKAGYARTATALLGKNTRVLDADPRVNAPGYTSADGDIHLAQEDELFNGLNEVEKRMARKGIFAHETLHQKFTDFKSEEYILKNLPRREKKIFSSIANILEDPAIEYMAPSAMGGHLLSSLRFIIKHTYKVSPKIAEPFDDGTEPGAFAQYMRALIQFGDMGILKGHFTSPEAEEIFCKTDELFLQGIMEPVGKARLEIAKEIFEISRPLWEEEAKNQEKLEELLKQIADVISEMISSEMNGSGSGETPNMDGSVSDSKKLKRQKKTIQKMGGSSSSGSSSKSNNCSDDSEDGSSSKNKSSKEDKDSKSGSGKDGDTDKKEDKNGENGAGDKKEESGKKEENGKDSGNGNGNKNKNDRGDKKDMSQDAQSSSSNSGDRDNPERTSSNDGDGRVEKSDAALHEHGDEGDLMVIDEDEYRLSKEDEEYILAEAEKVERDYERSLGEDESDYAPPENFDIETPALRGRSCLNLNVDKNGANIDSSYTSLVAQFKPQIRSITSQIKKIFEQDYEDKEYKTSGKINLPKMNSGKISSRIFEKKRQPTGKRDVAVAILVDESGSMSSSSKYVAAYQSCVALAEIFKNLDIPIYVMGFTADTKDHDIVHYHYIKWNNTLKNRQKLLNISARCNNCDGYSIRYITKILKKRKEANKLLIVLSDGQPAACNYDDGIADTKAAIREAKKHVKVLGVAIGNSDTDTIHNMYEKNFLHVSNVNDLFYGLARELKNIFKNI